MKIRRKNGMVMEEDLVNLIISDWMTIERLFATNEVVRESSQAALGHLLNEMGYAIIRSTDRIRVRWVGNNERIQ